MITSKPTLTGFNPRAIPYQYRVLKDIRANFNYTDGIHELLLSGAFGSAKSTLLAHLGVTHCLMYSGAQVVLCRRSLPDLKETIYAKILEHIEEDLVIGVDYDINKVRGHIYFRNGSSIISRYWSDGRFISRFRSLECSAALVEELTENGEREKGFYFELQKRIGRIKSVPENFIASATNPDAPSHWAYDYFMNESNDFKHVYYSKTEDNPFLPTSYVNSLKRSLTGKAAERYLYGLWVEIRGESLYHCYEPEYNLKSGRYNPTKIKPIHVCFDFNIAEGKPFSVCAFQFDGAFHFFEEFVKENTKTDQMMEYMYEKGFFQSGYQYIINGDATGRARSPSAQHSNYQIIEQYLRKWNVDFKIQVPRDNPPIAKRHNVMNAYFRNMEGERRIFVYENCRMLDKGFRLVKIKADGKEDDSLDAQHVTTAAGYGVCETLRLEGPSFKVYDRFSF